MPRLAEAFRSGTATAASATACARAPSGPGPRTQSSIAVSADNINWVLFNASPDLLAQLKAFPELQPARAIRDTAIRSIVLMDAQIDHTTGLLMLREGKPLEIYCTDMAREDLTTGNPLFNILEHYCGVHWHQVPTERRQRLPGNRRGATRFYRRTAEAARRRPIRRTATTRTRATTSACASADTRSGKVLFYAPGLGEIEPHLRPFLEEADCLMVDGTFWTDDEMIRLGVSKKHARDIGHLPQSGAGGMIEVLKPLEGVAQDTHPHQQHQSHPRRRLERAQGTGRRAASKSRTTAWTSHSEQETRMGAAEQSAVEQRRIREPVARQGQPLSHPSSVPHRDEQRQVHPGAGAGLGLQPLLLPDQHPDQGRSRARPT